MNLISLRLTVLAFFINSIQILSFVPRISCLASIGRSAECALQSDHHVVYIQPEMKWDKELFLNPIHYDKYIDYILLPNGIIQNRIEKLVHEVADVYHGKDIVFVCVLKGQLTCSIFNFAYHLLYRIINILP
jgi:hypothetical protein